MMTAVKKAKALKETESEVNLTGSIFGVGWENRNMPPLSRDAGATDGLGWGR